MNVRVVLFVLTTLLSVTSIRGGILPDGKDIAEEVIKVILDQIKPLIPGLGELDKLKNEAKAMVNLVKAVSANNISALDEGTVGGLENITNRIIGIIAGPIPVAQEALNLVNGAVGVMTEVVDGVCESKAWTKITIECRQLTVGGKKSTCCPPCDLIWPETVSVLRDAAKENNVRNRLLAMARHAQIVALAVGGLAGAVPFVGDVAANPANAIVSAIDMVLPTNPSDELQCMREQFLMMKEQMDRMEARSFELPFHNEYMAFRKKLSNLKDYFNNMEDAVSKGNCASQNDVTCEAVQMWRSHCNWTDPSNNLEDPNHLFQELHTLVTGNLGLFGPKFLKATSMAENKFEHLFQVYFSIATDIHGLKILNKHCDGPATPTNDSKQRSSYAEQKASQIQEFLKDFLMQKIKSKVEEDTTKLDNANATKESKGKDWGQLANILLGNRQNPKKGREEASAELANQYPLFRTDCSTYNLTDGDRNRDKHADYYKAPKFVQAATVPPTAMDIRISYEETPRIHIIDGETVCYTFIPVLTLESITNNLEYLHCNSEYKRWLEKTENKIGVKDWKPTSPFCEEWRDQEYFLADEKRRIHWIEYMRRGADSDRLSDLRDDFRDKIRTQV